VLAPEFVKALVLLNRHNVLLGLLRDLLLLDGHMDLELSLHFLLLHTHADSDNLFLGERAFTFIGAMGQVMLGLLDHSVRFLDLLLDGLFDLVVSFALELSFGSLELLEWASSRIEDTRLE